MPTDSQPPAAMASDERVGSGLASNSGPTDSTPLGVPFDRLKKSPLMPAVAPCARRDAMPSSIVARRVSDPDACAGAMRVRTLYVNDTTCRRWGPGRVIVWYVMPGTMRVSLPAAAPLVGTGVGAPSAGAAVTATAVAAAAVIRALGVITRPFKPDARARRIPPGRS